MAYTWEPKWEKVRLEKNGIVIHTCRDKITGMIACPICVHAASKCLGLSKPSPIHSSKNLFFFTVEDLIIHIREYHAYRMLRRITNRREERSAG